MSLKALIRRLTGKGGAINRATVAALNVPIDRRIRQLETNVVRLRTWAGNLPNRYVVANIPAAMVETVENGQVATRHAAGVGKIDRQSPLLSTKIPEVNFNPTWTVPASIIRKDLIPKMRKEPNYLTENKIRIIGPNGEIAPERVNWNSDEATRYTFRQDPGGEFNSLGFVRINIPSPHGVYMHDTPAKAYSATISASSPRAASASRTCATTSPGCSRRRPAGTAPRSTRSSPRASASMPASATRCPATGSTSPPGRRRMAASSSATTSTTRTASDRHPSPRSRASRTSERPFASRPRRRNPPATAGFSWGDGEGGVD